jgi:hypothetical protein
MLNQGQVLLSTFWHYQAHEKPEIGDPDEGQSGFIFLNDTDKPWEITPELLDAAAMSPKGYPRYSEPKTLPPGDESWIEAAGGFNTFMFSITEAEAPSKNLMEQLGYDCALEVCDIREFVNHTGQALRQHANREFGFDQKGITRLRCVYNSVKYVPKKRTVVTPTTVEVLFSRGDSVLIEELFTKRREFSYQREFRIAYYFMNPETDKAVSLTTAFPDLRPVIVGDAGIPRISKALRLIDRSEFVE